MTSQDPDAQSLQRAEAELRVSQLINENIPIGLHIYHLEDVSDDRTLRMVYANPAVKTLTGLGPEDVVGKTLDENCPGLRAKGIPQRYAEGCAARPPSILRTSSPSQWCRSGCIKPC